MRRHSAAALLALAFAASGVSGQTATATVSVTIPPLLVIQATGSFGFNPATDADYLAGYIESATGPTLSHRANVPYRITIAAQNGSTFDFVNVAGRADADPSKPVGDLRILSDIGGTAVDAAVGAAGSPNDLFDRPARGPALVSALRARMALDYATDPPGTYTQTVVFTIVAQ